MFLEGMKKGKFGLVGGLLLFPLAVFGQGQATSPAETAKKANSRPTITSEPAPEPFDGVPVEKLSGQCVTLDTEAGLITIEVMP